MSATEPKRFGLPLRHLTLVALIISPAAGGSAATVLIAVLSNLLNQNAFLSFGATILSGALYGGVWGVIPALVLGLPAHTALFKEGVTKHGPYIGIFTAIALVVMAVTSPFTGLAAMFATLPMTIIPFALIFSFAGTATGLIFWLIRRPDRDVERSNLHRESRSPENDGA